MVEFIMKGSAMLYFKPKFNTIFQIIKAVTKRNIINTIPNLKTLVELIKSTDREELSLIQQAREEGKGSPTYNYIKIQQLPCVLINFNYNNGYVTGENVSNPTGYLYIDVDNCQEIEINKDYVCAYWKSLSNNGYTIVVKVQGITKYNYKEATKDIAESLGYEYDRAAVSIDRVTVLSHDPNAYYNEDVEIFDVSYLDDSVETKQNENIEKSHFITIDKKKTIGYKRNGTTKTNQIRYDNLEEMKSTIDIIFDEEGVCDLGADNK